MTDHDFDAPVRYLRTTRSRATGTEVTVGHGLDLGLDYTGEGPWYTICEAHAQLCSHTTLGLARSFAADPREWCELCADAEPELSPDHELRGLPLSRRGAVVLP